jgi:phage-related protein
MAEVGEVKYKVEVDDSGVDKQIDKTEGKLKSKFGSAAKAVGAAAASAIAAGTAAVVSLVKQAAQAYGEFEQLEGGVKKLFGEDVKDTVMKNAEEAFRTAGLSANEYMETVTGFSSSLIQSLNGDTAKAADVADRAIRDMSDNANTFGTSMESIQNAYMGFAKGNFTMLDNLKLGYGGTKEEMARLIADASKMTDVQKELGIEVQKGDLSFANIANAISVVQSKLNIMGTTEKEAASTFQGSLSMMQGAWTNLVAGMANPNADIGKLIGDMINSAQTFLGNAIPIITQALEGIGKAIEQLAPIIAAEIPGILEKSLPGLLQSGAKVVESLASGILAALPKLMPTATNVVLTLIKMLVQLAPQVIQVGLQCILELVNGITKALPQLIPAAVDAIITIVEALTQPDMLLQLVDAAILLIMTLAEALIKAAPRLIEKAPIIVGNLVSAIIQAAPKLLQAAVELILMLARGIVEQFGKIIQVGGQIVDNVRNGFSQKVSDARNWGRDVIGNFIDGVLQKWNDLRATVSRVASTIRSYLHFSTPDVGPLADFDEYAPDMMDLFAKGIDDGRGEVEKSIDNVAGTVAQGFTMDVGYNLPDIAGYAADLSAAMTASTSTEIIIPLSINGREIARASAWFMNEQLAWEAR